MQGIYLIVFEVLIIIFFGIFVRTSADDVSLTSNITTLASGFYFLLAFTATSFKYKMLDWWILSNMLFILIICLQINTLYVMFWQSCFNGFYGTNTFTAIHVVVGIQAALAVMITCFQFIGQVSKSQIFLIAMIQVFFFSLNWVIEYEGVLAMTGGSTMTSFLFGYVFSIPIRKLKYSQPPTFGQDKQKYFTLNLKFVGLVILIFLWPTFNSMTAIPDMLLDSIQPILDPFDKSGKKYIKGQPFLMQQAYLQTFLCLLSAVITSLAVRIYGEKIKINHFVNSIINVLFSLIKTGILIGASASVIIDPFASVLLGLMGPILYLLYEKYISPLHGKGYPFDRVLMCLLAAIFNSIFVAGRSNRTPQLSTDNIRQGGLQFVNFIVSFLFALVSGLLTGFLLDKLTSLNDEIPHKDSTIWLIEPEIMPLYCDDPSMTQIHEKQIEKKLKKQQQQFNLKQNLAIERPKQNSELGKIFKQQIEYQSRIK